MQIAISSNSLGYNTFDALTRAADLQFKYVEIALQTDEFGYGYRRTPDAQLYRQMQQHIEQLSLSVWSVQPPQLTQRQMFSARARKDILMNSVGAAGILGARVVSVEPAHIFTNEQAYEAYATGGGAPPVIDGFDEIWAQVVNRRMTLALRNSQYYLGDALTNNAERIAKATFDLGIGWAADIRPAAARGGLETWLASVEDRLAVAYAYDLAEDGLTELTCEDPTWLQWLPLLHRTRLKCLVLTGHPEQENDEFSTARLLIERSLTPSR